MRLLVTIFYIRTLNLLCNYFCSFVNVCTTLQFCYISISTRFAHAEPINIYFISTNV